MNTYVSALVLAMSEESFDNEHLSSVSSEDEIISSTATSSKSEESSAPESDIESDHSSENSCTSNKNVLPIFFDLSLEPRHQRS